MVYSNLYTGANNKKIPTILGVFLIVFIAVFFFTLMNKSATPSRAGKINIKRTEVTNLSPFQVSIYWQTDVKETGWIVYGEKADKLTLVALDDRDVDNKKTAFINHYVTVRNLKPGGHYYYAIISENKKIVKPDGNNFEFTIPGGSLAKTKIEPATGKVLQANLNPLDNAVVLLYVDEKTALLSTITKDSGEWLIPLNSFFDKSTLEEKSFSGNEKARVEIISEDEAISTITSRLGDLALKNETIIIGKNYNLLDGNNVLSATSSFKNDNGNDSAAIIYPQEGSLIPGRRPLVKGTALPGIEVTIVINSEKTFSAKVVADKDGNWSYLLPEDLELGNHSITIKVKDSQGKETMSMRNFTIVDDEGNEGKVLGTASGSPTVTYAPTASPTAVPTVSALTPTQTPPVSGITNMLPIIGGIALLIVGGGILLVF